MKSLHIEFDQPQIEINGHVFDLLKSDGDILADAQEIQRRCTALDRNDADAVLAAIKEICGYVDTILGEGAMQIISGGKPVSINKSIEVMLVIAQAAAETYQDYLTEEYGQ